MVVVAGCFPDFAVVEGAPGDDGGAIDATGGDGSLGDGGARDGSADGASNDGSATDSATGDAANGDASAFDASGTILIPRTPAPYVFMSPGSSPNSTNVNITHDFYFDTTELTVATLRAWVVAAKPAPCTSATCTLDPGGPYASSIVWDSGWNQHVAALGYKDTSCQAAGISAAGFPTYNGTNDAVPINCINWYQAAALCWFDGQKRLPTQVEWQYVASGRGQGHTYPWGDTPAPSDCTRAIWRNDGGSFENYNGCGFPVVAGSTPVGASTDGVLDMAGSVAEWTWDWYDNTYPPNWPNDWTGPPEDAGTNFSKMARGGNWDSPESELHTNSIATQSPGGYWGDIGVRCVKTKL
jgi:formylglycine-generating enzyme required for sulfatase activity